MLAMLDLDIDPLAYQWQQGQLAEQHMDGMPPPEHPDYDPAHHAALLHIAMDGRQAQQQILSQPDHPAYQAAQEAAQQEHDQQIMQGLSSSELQLEPADHQQLAHSVLP